MRTGAGLLPERPASAVQRARISRCPTKWCSVLCGKSSCPRGICRRCIIERFPQTSKAFSFAGGIAISSDIAGGISCIISFDCHFGQDFF